MIVSVIGWKDGILTNCLRIFGSPCGLPVHANLSPICICSSFVISPFNSSIFKYLWILERLGNIESSFKHFKFVASLNN